MFAPGTFGTVRDWSAAAAVEAVLGRHLVPPKFGAADAPPGPPPGSDVAQWAARTAERLRAAVVSGRVRFARWLDPGGDETPVMRKDYWRMLAEPMVLTPLRFLVEAVSSLDLQFHPEDPEDPEQQADKDFAAHLFARVRGGPAHCGRCVLLPALVSGWSVTEPCWAQERRGRFAGAWVWDRWKSKDVRVLHPLVDDYDNVVGIEGPGGAPGSPGYGNRQVYDPQDFVLFSHLQLFEDPLGRSALRAAYRAWWVKDAVLQLRGIHLEKYTSPFLTATYQPGMEADQRAALEEALQNCQASTWLTVPAGVAVDAVTAATKDTGDFESCIQDCDREMLVAIMWSHLPVQEGKTANVAGSTAEQRGTTETAFVSYAGALGHAYALQVNHALRVNRGDRPRLAVACASPDSAEEAREVDKAGKALAAGFDLSRREVYPRIGYTPPADDADRISGVPKDADPGAPGGGGPGGAAAFGEGEHGRPFAHAEPRGGEFKKGGGRVGGRGKKPAAVPARDLGADVARHVAAREAERGIGLYHHDLYEKLRADHPGLTPEAFRRHLAEAHDRGELRLSMWPKSPGELPDPDLAVTTSELGGAPGPPGSGLARVLAARRQDDNLYYIAHTGAKPRTYAEPPAGGA